MQPLKLSDYSCTVPVPVHVSHVITSHGDYLYNSITGIFRVPVDRLCVPSVCEGPFLANRINIHIGVHGLLFVATNVGRSGDLHTALGVLLPNFR